jgi:Cu/Ag efflux pump CusA
VGIVVNDAILMLDQTTLFRKQGLSARAALLKACPMKLRTIIMTNSAIAISMFPQTLGSQGAAIMRASLSIVEIGAIVVQTTCTLTVIPVLYILLDRFSTTKYGAETWIEGLETGEEAEELDMEEHEDEQEIDEEEPETDQTPEG